MFSIKIEAEKDFDLGDVFDQLSEGELDEIATISDIKTTQGKTGLFAAGDISITKMVVTIKEPLSNELKAKLIAKLREMLGHRAHIHFEL